MIDELPREDVLCNVDEMVEELLAAAKIFAPPVDAISLARQHLGMIVCLDSDQPQRGRAQRSQGQKQIFLRPEPTEERHQWTVAHEIGEHMKPALLQKLGISPEQTKAMMGESLANLFAYHLLVPTCWFKADVRDLDYDLLALKKKYSTSSHEVIAWRFLDLPEPSIISIVDNDLVSRRKSNSFPVRKRLEPAEQSCQKFVHEHGKPKVVHQENWTVHGWPVHQIEWKREILRSVVDVE